ncbi:MAG: glycosyltransferase [Lachnospiraceae bacterium]|nr:glycosyltransferase [Lachnospiraceae bacterium]
MLDLKSLENKKVLFITTKNLDYIRNTQEIELLRQNARELKVLGSLKKSYPIRLLLVYFRLLTMSMKPYDVVFIGFSPQLVLPFWGWRFRKKIVGIDFFISVYDTMVCDRKKFRDGGVLSGLCRWLDRKTLRRSDFCVCDTNAHGDYFSTEFGVPREQFHTLYLKADTSIYYPRKVEKPQEVKNRFVVLYFGSVLPLQGIEVITDAMRALAEDERLFFYFIGPVPEQIQASNIRYIDWLPQKELAEHIAFADLCLAGHFRADIGKARRTIPGKAYIYRAMNKPMILGDNPANRELFTDKTEGIYFVPMGNASALKERILEIYEERCAADSTHLN